MKACRIVEAPCHRGGFGRFSTDSCRECDVIVSTIMGSFKIRPNQYVIIVSLQFHTNVSI